MRNALGVWNKLNQDLWFILRSSDDTGILLKMSPHASKILNFSEGEVVVTFIYSSRKEAEAEIGAGELHKFSVLES